VGLPSPTQAPALAPWRFPEPLGETQPRGSPLLFAGRARRRASPRAESRAAGARPWVRSLCSARSGDNRLQSTGPQLLPHPRPSTHFSRVPPLSMLSPPPPHSASEASQLPDGWTKIALTPSLIPARRSTGPPFYSIPATGCREGAGSSQQRFKGPDTRDAAAPSLPPPAPGSADWYPGGGGMQGACAMRREGKGRLGGWVGRKRGRW
jgi:hypothetical protein